MTIKPHLLRGVQLGHRDVKGKDSHNGASQQEAQVVDQQDDKVQTKSPKRKHGKSKAKKVKKSSKKRKKHSGSRSCFHVCSRHCQLHQDNLYHIQHHQSHILDQVHVHLVEIHQRNKVVRFLTKPWK